MLATISRQPTGTGRLLALGGGYIDSRGVIVIAPRRGMSTHMSHGLAAVDAAGTAYLGRDGQPLCAPPLSWSLGFNRFGFCLARSADTN